MCMESIASAFPGVRLTIWSRRNGAVAENVGVGEFERTGVCGIIPIAISVAASATSVSVTMSS